MMIYLIFLFRDIVCSIFDLYKQARIWDYFEKKKSVLLDPSSEQSVEEAGLQFNQDVSVT